MAVSMDMVALWKRSSRKALYVSMSMAVSMDMVTLWKRSSRKALYSAALTPRVHVSQSSNSESRSSSPADHTQCMHFIGQAMRSMSQGSAIRWSSSEVYESRERNQMVKQ